MPRSASVLVVGPDADAWSQNPALEDVDVTPAETLTAARAYLAGTTFDAVYVQPGAGPVDGLAALRDVLGLAMPIEMVDTLDDLCDRLGKNGKAVDSDEVQAALQDLKAEMSRVAHALNNPLAVIVGNVQLGLELSEAMDTDEAVVDSLRNVAEAAEELRALFGEISSLRARIDRLLGPEE